jgi:hypothetical protein
MSLCYLVTEFKYACARSCEMNDMPNGNYFENNLLSRGEAPGSKQILIRADAQVMAHCMRSATP